MQSVTRQTTAAPDNIHKKKTCPFSDNASNSTVYRALPRKSNQLSTHPALLIRLQTDTPCFCRLALNMAFALITFTGDTVDRIGFLGLIKLAKVCQIS